MPHSEMSAEMNDRVTPADILAEVNGPDPTDSVPPGPSSKTLQADKAGAAEEACVKPILPFDLAEDMDEARLLKKDLEALLEGVETVHLKTEVKAHISKLNTWAGRYCEGLDAAQKLSEAGMESLSAARAQISLTLEDYLRLEDEGGQVATPEQNRLIDELSQALRRIDRLSKVMANVTDSPFSEPPQA